jgi:hypothetical protein
MDIKRYFFERKLKTSTPGKDKNPWNPGQKIGFIVKDSADGQIDAVFRYIKNLKRRGKQVELIIYKDIKSKEQEDQTIYKNDINWYGVPKSNKVSEFLNKTYDMIFYMVLQPCMPTEFLLRTCQADLKIAPVSSGVQAYTNLGADCKNHDLAGILDEIDVLLDKLSNV